ncbi:hypothetical protein BV898_18833 [Hypsibius exemplaris]|uniref:Ig-like domain-containing protein n=1 Tax=Hypsibius exemplaris TaxID=2072580 RepID=A0A9X6NQQ4_HYPEX|nr:hypothetical protein BV898_18833 [Hypsibius exemplaris]
MDKNRLKYSATGSFGTTDEMVFVIQQVPVEVPKYLGEPLLIDLAHHMTVPAAVAHFNWTYRRDANSNEVALPADLTQQRQLLKINTMKNKHAGLYICSFYGGQDDAMAFFLGQKVFHVTALNRAKTARTSTSVRESVNSIKTRKNMAKLGWQRSASKKSEFDHPKAHSRSNFHGVNHWAPSSRTNHRSNVRHSDTERRRAMRRRVYLPIFEKSDKDDEDDDEDEDDEDEKSTAKVAVTSPVPVAASKSAVPVMVQQPVPTPALPAASVHMHKPISAALPPAPVIILPRPIPTPPKVPPVIAKDFAPMPGRIAPPTKATPMPGWTTPPTKATPNHPGHSRKSDFAAWAADFQANKVQAAKTLDIRNGSLMDFAGKDPAKEVNQVQVGSVVGLPCREAMDTSKVVWKRITPLPTTLTPTVDRYEVLGSGVLKLSNAVGEDSGEYGCEVDGKQTAANVALTVISDPLPRVFVTVKFTTSTCKTYLIEKLTASFVAKLGPHTCPDETCSMATPVMECHMNSKMDDRSSRPSSDFHVPTDIPSLLLSFNFKLGSKGNPPSDTETFRRIKEVSAKASAYIQKHGEIYQPDVFDGRLTPMIDTLKMTTFAYCPPGFGIKPSHFSHTPDAIFNCLACAPGHYSTGDKPVCSACNITQYQSKPAAATCDSCSGTKRVDAEGATSADDCDDPFVGMVKHHIIIAAASVLGVLLVAAGTFVLVRRRLAKKKAKILQAAIQGETIRQSLVANPGAPYLPGSDQQYPQYPPMIEHPDYAQIPTNNESVLNQPPAAGPTQAPSSGQISIVLNNQVPQPLPPPPPPAAPPVPRPSVHPFVRPPSNGLRMPSSQHSFASPASRPSFHSVHSHPRIPGLPPVIRHSEPMNRNQVYPAGSPLRRESNTQVQLQGPVRWRPALQSPQRGSVVNRLSLGPPNGTQPVRQVWRTAPPGH